ncbi:SAM-dependent methyltransferase [Streptomyces sp. NPDC001068]|uniref:SAM-dependent methyltransferase n=1 Tax=Streptomyces sp. NPDC001068 TaxID=3364544 RepID=UPI0036803042
MALPEPAPTAVDADRPHPVRVYDRWPGGKDDQPVDVQPARRIPAVDGPAPGAARAGGRLVRRALRAVAGSGSGSGVRSRRPRGLSRSGVPVRDTPGCPGQVAPGGPAE